MSALAPARSEPLPTPPNTGIELSVCLLGMNGRQLTMNCLESLAAIEGEVSMEILYLDNGSTDGVLEEVRARFPKVRVLEMGQNLGFPVPYNRAFKLMRGRYGLVLNNDTRIKPGAFRTAVDYLEANPDVGLLGANLLNPDGSRQNAIHNYPTILAEIVPKSFLKMLWPDHYASRRRKPDGPLDVECVLGAFMMFPRTLLDRIDGLDEGFFIYFEETDWCLRAARAGLRVVHHPDVDVIHDHGATINTGGKVRVAGRIEFNRSRYRYFYKHGGLRAWTLLYIVTMVQLLLRWPICSLGVLISGGQHHKLRGKWKQYSYLLLWHLIGRPRCWGLHTGKPDFVLRGTGACPKSAPKSDVGDESRELTPLPGSLP